MAYRCAFISPLELFIADNYVTSCMFLVVVFIATLVIARGVDGRMKG